MGKKKAETAPASSAKSKGGSGSNRSLRVLGVMLVVLLAAIAAVVAFAYRDVTAGERVELSQVYRLADAGEITRATLLDEDAQVVGMRCAQPGEGGECAEASAFHADYPASDAATQTLVERLTAGGAAVAVDSQPAKGVAKFVAMFILPLAMLANLFGLVFMWRGDGDGQVDEITGFSKMERSDTSKGGNKGPAVSFAQVAGADEALTELREVSEYLAAPQKFAGYGAAVPKGVLLLGPPGCGKTLLAKAVAGESQVPFFSVAGTEFVESLVGVGAARVRDLFAQVRAAAPAIVFIDEIDAVGRARGGEGAMSSGEREQTLNQLLVELDGFEASTGIVLIGATNRADILDKALMRPGRFDRHVTVTPPDVAGRQAILELHAASRPVGDDVDFAAVARRTPGFTGADLANVVNEAALLAIRAENRTTITHTDFSEAVMRVLHGPRRFGTLLTDDERHRLAVHEAGHAVVAAALDVATVDRISILPRGGGLGQTTGGDDGDRVLHTAGELAGQLAAAMSGLAAEQLVLAETATTADDDLDRANQLARQMAGRYGMAAGLGRLRVLRTANGHLGHRASLELVSGQTLTEFDGEVKQLLAAAEQAATDVLAAHRDAFDTLVATLADAETLEGAHLDAHLAPVRGHHHPFTDTLQPAGNGHARKPTTGGSSAKQGGKQPAKKTTSKRGGTTSSQGS